MHLWCLVACLYNLAYLVVFALGEEEETYLSEPGSSGDATGSAQSQQDRGPTKLSQHDRVPENGKAAKAGDIGVFRNGALARKDDDGETEIISAHSKSWLRGGDPRAAAAFSTKHSIILPPQENRQSMIDKAVEAVRPLQAGVMQVHIAPLHRRAPILEDPRPKWEQTEDDLEHELEMRYDELAVEFRVTDEAGIDVIQLYLPERQDCHGSGQNLVCSGYEFMTEPKKEFAAAQGEGPGFGGCVFRRHNSIGTSTTDMKLPSDEKVEAEEIDFDKDILSCMVNNRIGDGEPDMPRRSGLEIVFKKTFIPKEKSGRNLFRYFIIMIQNPNQSPVWPRLDAHGTDANSYIFQWGKRREGYKSEVIAFPAQDIKPLWTCTYTSWVKNKECTARCGGGELYTTRKLLHLPPRKEDPRFDPLLLQKCDEPLFKTEPCNRFLCDVDCKLGPWVSDGGCSAPCGGGYVTKRRHIIQPPRGLGKPCPSWNDVRRVVYEACNTQLCDKENCEVADEEWTYTGICSEVCGAKGGVRYKFRQVPRKELYRKDYHAEDKVEVIKEYEIVDYSGYDQKMLNKGEGKYRVSGHKTPIWVPGTVIEGNPHKGIYSVTVDGETEMTEYRRHEIREAFPQKRDKKCLEDFEKNGKCACEADACCEKSIYDDNTCLSKYSDAAGRDCGDGCETVFVAETCGTMKPCLDFEVHSYTPHIPPVGDMWHEIIVIFKLHDYAKVVEVRAPEGFTFGPDVEVPCVLRHPSIQPNGKPAHLTFTTSFECIVSGHGRHAVLKFKNALEPTPPAPESGWEPKYSFEIWVRHPPCEAENPPNSLCSLKPSQRRWSLGIWTEFPGVWEEHEYDGYQLHASAKKVGYQPVGSPEGGGESEGDGGDESSLLSIRTAGNAASARSSSSRSRPAAESQDRQGRQPTGNV